MRIDLGKLVVLYLCVSTASCWCFQKQVQALTNKVNELFNKQPCEANPMHPMSLKVGNRADNTTNGKYNLFGIDWSVVSSKISNNWWIIAMSSLLPFVMYWRTQCNMRQRLVDWRKVLLQKQKANNNQHSKTRRLTLPDLTLAKHARRESLAEGTQKFMIRRKQSQNNITQFRSTRKSSFERNDDSSMDVKRIHLIRRH